jgi:6-phosphogluconolactonase
MADVRVFAGADDLARAVAEEFVELAATAIADRGRFVVALAGGSTPRTAYTLLASEPFVSRVDWSHVFFLWGDERCAPPDHSESNYRMAREALLDHVPVPERNVFRILGEEEPAQAADTYEDTLRTLFDDPIPRFDLVMLGMGVDGHTASLFPGTAAVHEAVRWVVAHRVEELDAWRVTLTPVVLNGAANVLFIVSGEGKAKRLREVLEGPFQPDVLPAQIVRPSAGRLVWMVDEAAAVGLSGKWNQSGP